MGIGIAGYEAERFLAPLRGFLRRFGAQGAAQLLKYPIRRERLAIGALPYLGPEAFAEQALMNFDPVKSARHTVRAGGPRGCGVRLKLVVAGEDPCMGIEARPKPVDKLD